MLKIHIQGLKDGIYDVDIESDARKIPDMFEEFFGIVSFKGQLRILGKRYTITGTASCMAKLLCDLSLQDFEEEIQTEIKTAYRAIENLATHSVDRDETEMNEYFIKDDEKFIDISSEVREELAVHLPMKRIAPEYRGKSFDEIHPELTAGMAPKKKKKLTDEEIDDRWGPLKSLKFKKN